MTATTTAHRGVPRTLMQAHEELVRARPCRKASLSVWLSYYQHSVAVYEQIAKTDPGHECEACIGPRENESTPRGSRPESEVWDLPSN